jgi:hypothetical protein
VKQKRLAALSVAGVLGVTLAIGAIAEAHHDDSPTQDEIDFAVGTSDLMVNTTVAALLQEINETTPQNAAQGSQSISLVFDDHNHNMRLVGTLDPLHANDRPEDHFEVTALDAAMTGQATTAVERIDGEWYYRRTVPLSNFAPQCQMCHPNFASLSSSDWVGALMLRIPINTHHH